MKGERTVEKRRERNTKKTLLDIYSKYGIILILILIMAFLTIRTGGTFIGKNNLLNILKQIACIGVLACGQTAVIIAGGMDLSVGEEERLSINECGDNTAIGIVAARPHEC